MKKTSFKTLLCILSLAMVQSISSHTAQGIQSGNLIIHNTLNEPVQYQVATRLDGHDPATGVTIRNSSASNTGFIPANSQTPLSSGFFIGGNTWGSTINLTFRRASGGTGLQTQIQQLGTYILLIDERGNLVLVRQ